MMKLRFIHIPAFTHKTVFSSGNLLLDDSENKLSGDDIQKLLRRHTSGDWGDVQRYTHGDNPHQCRPQPDDNFCSRLTSLLFRRKFPCG
ncbi:hypothetical protein QB788_004303 [Salmonella enterica]|nr:hypothetical protein [Salmonella enterica]